MNKTKNNKVTLVIPNFLRLLCYVIGFTMLVNPVQAEAKSSKTQKSSSSKSSKPSKKSKTSKKTTKTTAKESANPADSLFPEPETLKTPEPAETEPEVPVLEEPSPEESTPEKPATEPKSISGQRTQNDRGYRISVGPLLGVRTMKMQGDRSSYEHNAPFYMGGMLDAELRLHRFSNFDGALWFQAEAGYGTTIGGFGHVDLANRSTAIAFLSGQLLMKRQFGDDWDMEFGLGMQALSLTVEPNLTYTGHRYIGPEVGLSARRWLDNHRLSLGTELYALPVLWVNKSSQTDDAQSFGFRAGAELGWSPGEATWALRLRYRFQRFRTQFPLASEGSRGAVSEDNQHLLMLMFSY